MTDELKSTGNKKGWLLPYLIALDKMFFRRWEYWTEAVLKDRIPNEPIPYIRFQSPHSYPEGLVSKNLKQCLDYAEYSSSNVLELFINWLLWGFNHGKSFPPVNARTDDYWYRTFNLGLFYKEPADHLALLAADRNVGKAGGYFPTPANVVEMIVRMNFGSEPKPEHKRMSVCDPCSGSGIMLLYASNYSLNLYGMDINPLITKIAIVNSFIYVPWLACRPKSLRMFEEHSGIIEIDLPTGIRIPKCQSCNGQSMFLMDIETDHSVVMAGSMVTVNQPKLSVDLVRRKLKPENITCAACYHKLEKEKAL